MKKPLISVGELIDQSWDVYRLRFVELLSISGWFIITAILLAVALAFYPSATTLQGGSALTTTETMGVILFSLTTLLITPLLSFWLYTSLTKILGAHFSRKQLDPKKALREGRDVFLPTALTSLRVMMMIFLAIAIGFGPAAVMALIGSLTDVSGFIILANLLLVIGTFVSLFLSIKWMVYYILAPLLTILDGVRGSEALAQSRSLIEGRFWSVLVRIAVPKLVFVLFGVFAMSIIGYLVGILINASSGINLDIQLRISTMTQTIIPILIATFINPLVIISDVLILRSLKE
ncbi:hypothetical protein HYV70_01915 [Candidatus Uhrbacteria bacterium]|nr:hypothetical protein [Candidatus Uhrbacteria bacterium]